MQLVVVMAVRAAVMAATMTLRMSSQMLFFFIVVSLLFTVYGLLFSGSHLLPYGGRLGGGFTQVLG